MCTTYLPILFYRVVTCVTTRCTIIHSTTNILLQILKFGLTLRRCDPVRWNFSAEGKLHSESRWREVWTKLVPRTRFCEWSYIIKFFWEFWRKWMIEDEKETRKYTVSLGRIYVASAFDIGAREHVGSLNELEPYRFATIDIFIHSTSIWCRTYDCTHLGAQVEFVSHTRIYIQRSLLCICRVRAAMHYLHSITT